MNSILFKIVLLFDIILISLSVNAQQQLPVHFFDTAFQQGTTANICSNDMLLYHLRKDPNYKAKEEKMNREILNAARTLTPDTIILPVVVHIINQNPGSVTDIQVINGIKELNDAYGKAGLYSTSSGVDTKIRFCLAQKNPDGGNSTGITRTKSFFSTQMNMDNEDARLKNLVQWDPSKYINIWLITNLVGESYANFSCGQWYRVGVSGYASMPPDGGSLDGLVVNNFGALMAHEMGHYLGLYHTFEGWCKNDNCLIDGDRVCDTPPDGSVFPSGGCNNPNNTCNSDTLSNYSNGFFPIDVPDQIANIMDYGNPGCSNQFTQGQADRMRAVIITQRSGLLQDECTKPCIENITAVFTRDIAYPIIGDFVTFTNNSSGAANYQWLVNGVVVSSAVNFSYTFNSMGKNKITLKAYNTINCFASYSDFVIITCGVTARFYPNKKTIASKIPNYADSIFFSNTSYNGQSFKWLMSNDKGMNEQVISTNTDLTYVFPTPASYKVRLIATNGACSDTSETYIIPVYDPTPDAYPFNTQLLCYDQTKIKVSFCIANNGYDTIPKNTPVSFYDADPRLPGANKLSPSFYLTADVRGLCGNCYTHILDATYRDIEKVYIAINDSGKTIPIVFPNTSLEERFYENNIQNTPPNRTEVNVSICEGQNYGGHTKTGTYIDTLFSLINGCDSVRTLQLSVTPKKFIVIDTTICSNELYFAGGQFQKTSGVYRDTAKTYLGCDSIITTNLKVNPSPIPDLGKDIGICMGDSLILAPGNFTSYLWQNGSTNASLTIHKIGIYSVTVKNTFGCKASDTMSLKINPLPANFLAKQRDSACRGSTLQVKIPGYINYNWSTGSNSNSIDITKAGAYSLQVTDRFGCIGMDSMKVVFTNCVNIQIPNAFTPNKDGKNDVFKPLIPSPVTNYHMQVWNRWGEKVFETRNPVKGWDGTIQSTPQPSAAYVYLITLKDIDGVDVKKSGTVVLIK